MINVKPVVFGMDFRLLADAAGVFFSPLAGAAAGFFSVVFTDVLVVDAVVEPSGFLGAALVEVFFSTPAVVVFLATPLACVFCVPFVKRLWAVVGRELAVDVLVPAVDVFVLAGAFVLVLGSAGFSFPVLSFAESAPAGCGSPSVCVPGEA